MLNEQSRPLIRQYGVVMPLVKGEISLTERHLKREGESKKIKTWFKQNQNIFTGKLLIFHSALMIILSRDFHGKDSISTTTRN